MGDFRFLMLNFIYVVCEFMCDMRYLICFMFSFICNVSRSIYNVSVLLCCMSETIYVVCKKSICLLQFNCNKGNKIALSVSIFVVSIFLCCICKIIYSCARLYVAFAKLYVALTDSPLDLWWSLLLCYF